MSHSNLFEQTAPRIFIILFCILTFTSFIKAQDVMLQGWYWDYPKTANGENWSDTLQQKMSDISTAGFSHVWMPPLSRASFGSYSNGYDPQDLYDLGEYGLGATGYGTRAQVDATISAIKAQGMVAVADVVYNHRDGGAAENNPAVEGWIENMNCTKINNGDQPYPSDRYRLLLPIGGSTGNGAGIYYIKIRSASTHPNFYDKPYKFYAETNTTGYQNLPAIDENESAGNGGGDCLQGNIPVGLGVDVNATIDNVTNCGGYCGLDEFALNVSASDFNSAGDTIYFYLTNSAGYTDHFIAGIWNGSADVQSQVIYQTYTDFTNMPSGQGAMNYQNFKPNGNPTNLGGDWDSPLFFYDYDQSVSSTRQSLIDWTQWLYSDVEMEGIRMDAVKHFDPGFVAALLDSMHNVGMNPSMVVGEFFDTNPYLLKQWFENVYSGTAASTDANIDVRVFDFALRSELKNACDAFGYDVRNLYNKGVVGEAGGLPNNVVTFVNNHDYRSHNEAVQNNPELAYAYILSNRQTGIPSVFYPDVFGVEVPDAPTIEMLTDITKINNTFDQFMVGGTYDYLNRFGTPYSFNFFDGLESTSLIYQTTSGGIGGNNEAIVVINFAGDTLDVEFDLSSGSSMNEGDLFEETTGKGLIPISAVLGTNRIRLAVPPRSYGIWVSNSNSANCDSPSLIYVDKNATGMNSGESWENAFNSLNAAIHYASLCTDVDSIWIKEGEYFPNITNNRSDGFVIDKNLILRGGFPAIGSPTFADYDPINNPVILSGNIGLGGNNSDNVFHVFQNTSGFTSEIHGVIFEKGHADGAGINQSDGGGIVNESILLLKDCIIRNNSAAQNGSGIFGKNGSTTTLMNCTIELNNGTSEIFIESGGTIISSSNNTVKN